MPLFGRRKPLHERLLEQGGLETAPPDDRVVVGGTREPGVHGLARRREWDTVATVRAADIPGNELAFDVLPDRTLLVEEEVGEKSLAPLAEAVERDLEPPYRARAVRQGPELWAVAARAIEVVSLPEQGGERIELTVRNGERSLAVDGAREFGSVPELEGLASGHADYTVRAERLDEGWWEVRVDPL